MKRVCGLIVTAIVTVSLTGARAEVMHKWYDENGQIHFSDRAPIGMKSETTEITSASGVGNPDNARGLRKTERQLLDLSRAREQKDRQARRRSVSKYEAVKLKCRSARDRYDRAKRKPGAAKSKQVRKYFDKMRALCS